MSNFSKEAIITWLKEKKAENIRIYDMHDKCDYTDTIIVCEGNADVHNKAIANYLLDMLKENHLPLLSKEGIDFGHWILIDGGEIIVHIFLPETRDFYHIDDLLTKIVNTQTQESNK